MNKQITESYVSFEIAQLLKEKGFDEYCLFCYEQNVFSHTTNLTLKKALYRDILIGIKNSEFEENAIHNVFTAPSQSLALKWLREVHGIYITAEPDINDNHCFYPEVYTMTEESWDMQCFEELQNLSFAKPEQAVEVAILYVLKNLI